MAHWIIPETSGHACSLAALIHGRIGVERITKLTMLGNLCDRGPKSREVLDILLTLRQTGIEVTSLRGSQEDLLLKSIDDEYFMPLWMLNGGSETLESFRVKQPADIPAQYLDFLLSTKYYEETPGHVLVHAGLDFSLPLPIAETPREKMMWLQQCTVDTEAIGGRKLVTGRTVRPLGEIIESLPTDSITLNNGICRSESEGMGNLLGLCLDSGELIVQRNIDQYAKAA